jgi:hypothetical protein
VDLFALLTIRVRDRGDADGWTRARSEIAAYLRERVQWVQRPGPETAEVGRSEMHGVEGCCKIGKMSRPVLREDCFNWGRFAHCICDFVIGLMVCSRLEDRCL